MGRWKRSAPAIVEPVHILSTALLARNMLLRRYTPTDARRMRARRWPEFRGRPASVGAPHAFAIRPGSPVSRWSEAGVPCCGPGVVHSRPSSRASRERRRHDSTTRFRKHAVSRPCGDAEAGLGLAGRGWRPAVVGTGGIQEDRLPGASDWYPLSCQCVWTRLDLRSLQKVSGLSPSGVAERPSGLPSLLEPVQRRKVAVTTAGRL
jgi:hypothetical protein